MISCLALVLAMQSGQALHVSDLAPLNDPTRPVTQITTTSFTLQYYTTAVCETKVEIRGGEIPRVAFGHAWEQKTSVVTDQSSKSALHRITISHLEPGKRYFYRVWDPAADATDKEKRWGAGGGFGREYAVSTEAPKGYKTIIHLPVKVLLMPNVINIESAYVDPEYNTPLPPKITPEQLQHIKDEFAVSSRFFWVNSGMRLWVDYQFFVDDRWQRWGPEPPKAEEFYKNWPVCRSYAGVDYQGPGGGDFTVLDTKNPTKTNKDPVAEERPFSGQVEMAWPRKWNPVAKRWDFYNSGGGTYGVDSFPDGISGRSQFLGGGDTAWLATHEFHHDLESHGEFSLSNREDDRIVFDHPAPRKRVVKGDGSVDETTWTTNGRHGEHWDVMSYWDRTLTDAQWLRMYFGYTTVTKDADEDGVPDDDPRLPLDEKRFGSNPHRAETDGLMGDLAKAMLSIWAPGPLQPSWIKPPYQGVIPDPTKIDQDGDGIPDALDPDPLIPNPPLIPDIHPVIDGDTSEWKDVPVAGSMAKGELKLTFKQGHDEAGYYGFYEIHGPWAHIDATFDGEGLGVYSGVGVLGFSTLNSAIPRAGAGPTGVLVETRPAFAGAPGLRIKAQRLADGLAIEFRMPNRGESPWYWTGGGREIGVSINVFDNQNRGYSLYEPYHPFYCRMVEPHGKEPLPGGAPPELTEGIELKPGDKALKFDAGWALDGDSLKYKEGTEPAVYVDGLAAHDFDLMVDIEAKSDAILAGFTKATKKMTAAEGYVGFVGGYSNTASRLRIFGNEQGDSSSGLTPGRHHVQLSRRQGDLWLMVDGKPVVWAADPNPRAVLDRLAILGGYGGDQVIHSVRYRLIADK